MRPTGAVALSVRHFAIRTFEESVHHLFLFVFIARIFSGIGFHVVIIDRKLIIDRKHPCSI